MSTTVVVLLTGLVAGATLLGIEAFRGPAVNSTTTPTPCAHWDQSVAELGPNHATTAAAASLWFLLIAVTCGGARSASEWIRLMASAALRRADASSLTEMVTARELTISFDRTLPWEVDGGDRKRTATYEVRRVPQAIRICQPVDESPTAPPTSAQEA